MTISPIPQELRAAPSSNKLEVVLCDFGCADFASPEDRFLGSWVDCSNGVPVCTPEYRAPDVFLGSRNFGADLDLWSMGCVAAELFLRRPLFEPSGPKLVDRSILDAHFAVLGKPSTDSDSHNWIKSLPLFDKFYGSPPAFYAQLNQLSSWPPDRLRDCPPQLLDFVKKSLQWHPRERWAAASAISHSFLNPPPLSVVVSNEKAKNGQGSIVKGSLEDDVLEYLQQCQTWKKLHEQCRRGNFTPNSSVVGRERALRMKRAFVSYIDENNPPRCISLNSDTKLKVIEAERLVHFAKAFRRRNKEWLYQLTARVRAEIRRQNLPEEFLATNGIPFVDEDFADNAFVYGSVQLMKVGAREDGWHTDGGASLLHASLTVFGSRAVEVKLDKPDCISLSQEPGSFYVGNMCAMQHNVKHKRQAEGCYGEGPKSQQVQIAVMLRSDVFRKARARKINSTPGHSELYRVVNTETAKHLADFPLYLPDLAAVIAESRGVNM